MLEPTPSMKCIRYILLSFNALFTVSLIINLLKLKKRNNLNNFQCIYLKFYKIFKNKSNFCFKTVRDIYDKYFY